MRLVPVNSSTIRDIYFDVPMQEISFNSVVLQLGLKCSEIYSDLPFSLWCRS